jgi:hypothetical protein
VLCYYTKNKLEGRHSEGSIRDPKNKRMEETSRRMETSSEGGQGPEGAVAT